MTEEPPSDDAAPAAPGTDGAKPSKADRLLAKSERIREREAERETRRAERAQTPSPASRAWAVAVSALSVVVVALAVLLVVTYVGLDDARSQRRSAEAQSANRGSVLEAAKTWATEFGSYDYRHLSADFAAASKYMTPSFAKSYTSTSEALAKTFVAYKTQVTASVPAAAVISASDTKATALVLLDQVIKSSQTTTPKINRNRLIVQLVHTKGHWLIAKTDAT